MSVRYILGPDAGLDVTDRGLAYGDGLFETMAVRNGRVLRLDLHLARLGRGCERLEIPTPDATELTERVEFAARGIVRGDLKLILTRGSGPRGYLPPSAATPVVVLLPSSTAGPDLRELSAVTLSTRLGENEKLAGIKHLCRLEQVIGRLELARTGADEGVMLSASGHVISGTSRNLFAAFGDRLVTPRLRLAGIEGVMRRSVIEACVPLGIALDEADLRPAELADATEVFMTNALVGIQSVLRLDHRDYASDAMASTLRSALQLDD